MNTSAVTRLALRCHRVYRRGFTLIELLVVLGMIGLLAAILLPLFARAREGGYRTTCLSNERQLGLGILAYTADSDSVFPNNKSLENTGSSPGRTGQWALQIFPYIKSAALFHCPDDPTQDAALVAPLRPSRFPANSYGINLNLLETVRVSPALNSPERTEPAIAESVLAVPAKTVALFEVTGDVAALSQDSDTYGGCAASGNGNRNPFTDWPFPEGCYPVGNFLGPASAYATGAMGGRVWMTNPAGYPLSGIMSDSPRHRGGAIYAACDGHVVWLRPETVSGGQNQPPGGETCGQDDAASACGGSNRAAGTENKYSLTFSIR